MKDRDRRQGIGLPHRYLSFIGGWRPAHQYDGFGGAHHPYPVGIVVACQGERSQHKNRATAWNMLRARLYEQEIEKREAAANATEASKPISAGPSDPLLCAAALQLVKDLRTGVTSGSPGDVLDGELDNFMEASLAQKLTMAARSWSRT